MTGSHRKKVFVSGCFDLLHSGHIAFFEQAANYGDLYVAIGSDKTIFELKGREPVNSEDERLYMSEIPFDGQGGFHLNGFRYAGLPQRAVENQA